MSESRRKKAKTRAADQEAAMDTVIGYVLLSGVLLSVCLIVAGVAWNWIATGHLGIEF